MPLTLYLSVVQKVEVMPDRAPPRSACDNTVIAEPESWQSIVVNTLSVMTNSTTDNSNKKQKKHIARRSTTHQEI